MVIMTDDRKKKVVLMLAEDICPGCACYEHKVSPQMLCHKETPCPHFHLDNFYYDGKLKRFWCRNWTGGNSDNISPQETV